MLSAVGSGVDGTSAFDSVAASADARPLPDARFLLNDLPDTDALVVRAGAGACTFCRNSGATPYDETGSMRRQREHFNRHKRSRLSVRPLVW